VASGFWDKAPRAVRGAFPSTGLGHRVVSHHYRPITSEETPFREEVGHCPSPRQGGQGARRTSGSRVLYRGAGARALA
jgi:hypothetical protein